MASRAAFASVLLAILGVSHAVVYNYNNGGQDWNVTTSSQTGVPLCGSGMNQSPINLADEAVTFHSPLLQPLMVNYSASNMWELEVTANYLEIAGIETVQSPQGTTVNNADGVTVDGTFIPLNQFHFHTPSEHTVNGMHYPLEMHMVHKLFNASNKSQLLKAAVIGIFFAYDPMDQPGNFLSKFQAVFNTMTSLNADSSDVVPVNQTSFPGSGFNLMTDVFGPVAVGKTDYYRYNGSLTTPACSEGINWHLMARPLFMSRSQLLSFTRMLAIEQGGMGRGGDNRLIQPLNGRTILASFKSESRCKSKWYKNKKNGKWVYGCLKKEDPDM